MVHSRTLESLDRRGLLAEFAQAQERLPGLAAFRRNVDDRGARGHG
ncbi:hypothetical protein ACFVFQ_21350 [Streptomyces sp. NPDC057743]